MEYFLINQIWFIMKTQEYNYIEITNLIHFLCTSYELLYGCDRDDFSTKYCYYFAHILKKLIPEGHIYYISNPIHYIFEYQGLFYDQTGLLEGNNQELFLNPHCHLSKQSVFPTEEDNDPAEIVGAKTNYKDIMFTKYGPNLIEFGMHYLQDLQNSHARKKNPFRFYFSERFLNFILIGVPVKSKFSRNLFSK